MAATASTVRQPVAAADGRLGYCRGTTHIARTRRLDPPCPLSHHRTVKSWCDLSWVAQVRAEVEPRVDADRDHVTHRRLSGSGMRPGDRTMHDVRRTASAILRSGMCATSAALSAAGCRPALPAKPTRAMDARDAPAAIPAGAKESDASVGSDFGERGEGGVDDTARP
jgi:hypothetical protein